ncbi:MAG: aminopeptidase P family protein [Melioribacteraceae bacterium]|nr:aminopeptidase P family protein [Melioribacteraceae bacterium]MCF8354760.1 aminopeptidase P family protein [Melioribacteraceae bacterium]MCF8394385.1 aminopeptidase P family protein [Melioribacteraceae bacterium]MCF8417519.1 aminopeptidase P family protein [Melioribacteraceae bacterium]
MFPMKTYVERRRRLKELVGKGIVIIPGNEEAPMNYPANTYQYRQDSTFLYYFGLDAAGLNGIIDIENDSDMLFGDDFSIDDIVWMGPQPALKDEAKKVGVEKTEPKVDLEAYVKNAIRKGRDVHFLPQYRFDTMLMLEDILGIKAASLNNYASEKLIKAVISQRSIKTDEEVAEIENAVAVSYEMNTSAMRAIKPGMVEREIFGMVEGIALSKGRGVSFPIIFSIHGETLHNHHHENLMKDGDIVVLDSGAESLLHYASDITRTFPVNGKFSDKQKDVYQVVLDSQMQAIDLVKPGKKFKEIHLHSCKVIAEGLKNLGLMKGDVDAAVDAGAHALFMPHGLGHMMGLDVHDMEGLGEKYVGYDEETKRSDQFGLAYLRLGRELQTGFVFTVEPGIYFIPQLIDMWKNENKHADFLNYEKIEEYKSFGGIRIEDDVLVTSDGYKVLGDKPIPKTVEDVETVCNS